MKYTKYFNILTLTCLAFISFSQLSIAQNNEGKDDSKKQAIRSMIDSQHFVFAAQSVSPLRGRFRTLTSDYDVRVSKDTMVSYLPYFGRAYVAPLDPSGSALDFTSTNFSYSVTPYKKGGWNVLIKPKDKPDAQQFLFTIFDTGTATLSVNSSSRDAISFNGYVKKDEERKKKKKK